MCVYVLQTGRNTDSFKAASPFIEVDKGLCLLQLLGKHYQSRNHRDKQDQRQSGMEAGRLGLGCT